jgi:hypothetical protein
MNLDDYFDQHFISYKISELAKNYLARQGWFHTLAGQPKDVHGPVPWITYPAAAMLRRIVKPDFKVFEFGCGMSTIWWSKLVARVVSVDHNASWIETIRPALSDKVTVLHRGPSAAVDPSHQAILDEFFAKRYELPTRGNLAHDMEHGLLCKEFAAYAAEILNYPAGHFNVIVVDGMARALTAWLAARQLGEDGVILFDNSERWQYNSAYQLLADAGFARIDFWGVGPVQTFEWCTSLFVKNVNVFRQNTLISRGKIADLGW